MKHELEIQSLVNRGLYEEAESLINDRLQVDPENASAHYFLGVIHYFRGQIPLSVKRLKRALELDPKHTDAAICLSVLYNDIGRYDEAKSIFDRTNTLISHRSEDVTDDIDRKFALMHLEGADLYCRYRRYSEAIEEYNKAALLDPKDPEIRIRRASAYAKKGFISRAIQDLQRMRDEIPRFAPAHVQLGLLHFGQGNTLDAELEWEAALAIEPSNTEAINYLAMARGTRLNAY